MSAIVFGWVPTGRPSGAGIVSVKMNAWSSLISIPSVTSGLVRFTFSWSFEKASSIWRPTFWQTSRLVYGCVPTRLHLTAKELCLRSFCLAKLRLCAVMSSSLLVVWVAGERDDIPKTLVSLRAAFWAWLVFM